MEITPVSPELEQRVKEVEEKEEMVPKEVQAEFLKARFQASLSHRNIQPDLFDGRNGVFSKHVLSKVDQTI